MIWLNALQEHLNSGRACVVVSIADVKGSAPRPVGARMLVSTTSIADTIGGGTLEHAAIEKARAILNRSESVAGFETTTVTLGSDLSQCCGGVVSLNFEFHPASNMNVIIYGAGHVGQCLATVLQRLPCHTTVYDQRQEWLDKLPSEDSREGSVIPKRLGDNPFLSVESCPDNACYFVMTHSHELDFDLVEAIISRGDSRYCGLIASNSKAGKFKSRLRRKGFTDSDLAKLTSPIGASGKTGNIPMQVAIAAASELLQVWQSQKIQNKKNVSLDLHT